MALCYYRYSTDYLEASFSYSVSQTYKILHLVLCFIGPFTNGKQIQWLAFYLINS